MLLLKGTFKIYTIPPELSDEIDQYIYKAASLFNNSSRELDFKYDYRCSLPTCESGNWGTKFSDFWRNHSPIHNLCEVVCPRNQRKNNKVRHWCWTTKFVSDKFGWLPPRFHSHLKIKNFKRNSTVFHWWCWIDEYQWRSEKRKRKIEVFTFILSKLTIQWMIFIVNEMITVISYKLILCYQNPELLTWSTGCYHVDERYRCKKLCW